MPFAVADVPFSFLLYHLSYVSLVRIILSLWVSMIMALRKLMNRRNAFGLMAISLALLSIIESKEMVEAISMISPSAAPLYILRSEIFVHATCVNQYFHLDHNDNK